MNKLNQQIAYIAWSTNNNKLCKKFRWDHVCTAFACLIEWTHSSSVLRTSHEVAQPIGDPFGSGTIIFDLCSWCSFNFNLILQAFSQPYELEGSIYLKSLEVLNAIKDLMVVQQPMCCLKRRRGKIEGVCDPLKCGRILKNTALFQGI